MINLRYGVIASAPKLSTGMPPVYRRAEQDEMRLD